MRCCTILGEGRPHFEAWPLLEPVCLALFESIAQQHLAELHIISARTISPAAISVFLNSASTNLLLVLSPTVVDLLSSARLDVHKLWVTRWSQTTSIGIFLSWPGTFDISDCSAETTTHPRTGASFPVSPCPYWKPPSWTSIHQHSPAVLLDFISDVLALAPTLAEICVTFSTWRWTSLPSDTVTDVDNLLAAASQRLRMRWRLEFRDSPQGWDSMHKFHQSVRAGMPSLASTGRLIVERYFFPDEELSHCASATCPCVRGSRAGRLLDPHTYLWLRWRRAQNEPWVGAWDVDCCYGYDCRTQYEDADHTRTTNHLCEPTQH
ncbi:hypothetical protein C8R46DRAFT_1220905 [Mycena filopes]|nr:hypothetical protein C8R46DRAFT_1220905 [Mycena filopes]